MSRIDLFEQLKAFDYLCLTSSLPGITGNIRSVYFALLMTNNSTFWSENFEVDFDIILKTSRVDKDTYRRAMDYLKDVGLLTSYEKGINKYSRARVSLKVLTEKPTGNAEAGTLGNAEANRVPIAHYNKTKTNKTLNKKHTDTFVPPTEDEVVKFFEEKGCSAESARTAFEYYNVADWTDRSGKNVRNWKQKMLSVWIKNEKEKNSAQKEKDTDQRGFVASLTWANVEMRD